MTAFPHSAPLSSSLGGRGMADAASSPASATLEQQRLAGLRRLADKLTATPPEMPRFANLRDGALMPEPLPAPMVGRLMLFAAGFAVAALIIVGAGHIAEVTFAATH